MAETPISFEADRRRSKKTGTMMTDHPRVLTVLLLASVLIGALAGLIWHYIVQLPAYSVGSGEVATMSETQITQIFGIDAYYVVIGAVVGVVLGIATWMMGKESGWNAPVFAVVYSLIAALACWGIGALMGPRHFQSRLATATVGESVAVDFTLNTWVSVLIWPTFAVAAVLVCSIFMLPSRHRNQPQQVKKSNVTTRTDGRVVVTSVDGTATPQLSQ